MRAWGPTAPAAWPRALNAPSQPEAGEMDELVILYTTWPDAETAEAFGRRAVEERLAARANVLAPMRSIYRWDGEIQSEPETPMLLKTTAAAVHRLGRLILRYHPYKTP